MVRKANIKDIPFISDLLGQVKLVHFTIRPDLFKEGSNKYNDKELVELINNEANPIFVYETNDEVVGYIFCQTIVYQNDGTFNDHKTLYIDDLCVDKNHRHQGIATVLYNYVKNYAKENNYYNITLNVWEGNDALEFYKSIGLNVMKTYMEERI